MVLDAYDHIKALTHGWTSTHTKQAAQAACLWACSACTQHETIPNCSSMAIHITICNMVDQATFGWAQDHCHTYLPTPTQHMPANTQLHPTQAHTPSRTKEIALQSIVHSLVHRSTTHILHHRHSRERRGSILACRAEDCGASVLMSCGFAISIVIGYQSMHHLEPSKYSLLQSVTWCKLVPADIYFRKAHNIHFHLFHQSSCYLIILHQVTP